MGERRRTRAPSACSQSASKGTVALPHTFDEFLVSLNLDDWPKYPHLPEVDPRLLVSQITNDYPLDTVTQYLYDNAPLPSEIISSLEKKIDECKIQVEEHAKHVFTLESEKSEIDEQPEQVDEAPSPESQGILKKKKKEVKFPTDAVQDSNDKNLENYSFPGFNLRKLTKLPNNLEPAQLWDMVLKIQIFKGVNIKVLKQLFISEASLAILQDCFWWWFLHKFKPDQDEQDHFFDRISDSYVTLLWSIPNYIKDAFLQMYPDCLSQAIYVTFCEAFPQSFNRFDDQFKDELMDLVFQWIRGFKPQRFAWKKWHFWWMETPRDLKIERDSFCQMSSQINLEPRRRSRSRSRSRTLRFQLNNEEQKEERVKPKKESHYIGDGPDFQHSLFNLGGQSPLVSYYLHMRGIPNTLANSRGYRINHTEICKF
ncbi:protein FAM227B isoform 2-T2 [Liasis olivaceus]